MEVNLEGAPNVPKFKLEVTKNSKGYNYVVGVRGDDIEQLKEDVEKLEGWAKAKFS